ncbi:glycosyltransferase family 4 protein [Patescibacteria group bacterium]
MRIGIDISPVIYGTGVSTYTKNLVRALVKQIKDDELVLFGGSMRRKDELVSFTNSLDGVFESKLINLPPTLTGLLWNRLRLVKIETFTGALDVFHSSDWVQPPTKAYKVTTIHDMWPFTHPELVDPKIVSTHKARLKMIIKEVDHVIVPSKATATLLAQGGYPKDKISVIYEAVDSKIKKKSPSQVNSIRKKYKIGRYLLSVGTEPRKNIERIIKAYRQLSINDLELVVIGNKWGNYEEGKGIHLLGHVDREDISALYTGAEALVYPSIEEGFGLPILEAYACECPVVTSNISSMPEVAGDAAITVNPLKVNEIGKGIKKAIKIKEELIEKGINRLKMFSWDKNAKETYKIYQKSQK